MSLLISAPRISDPLSVSCSYKWAHSLEHTRLKWGFSVEGMQAGKARAPQQAEAAGARWGHKKGWRLLVVRGCSSSKESSGVGEEKNSGSELSCLLLRSRVSKLRALGLNVEMPLFQSFFVTNIALETSPLLTQRPRFSPLTSKDFSVLLLGDVAGQSGCCGAFFFFFPLELKSSWYINGPNGKVLRGSSNSLSKEVNGLVPEEGFGVSAREKFWGASCVLSDGSYRSFYALPSLPCYRQHSMSYPRPFIPHLPS